jgi:hypothetical protein
MPIGLFLLCLEPISNMDWEQYRLKTEKRSIHQVLPAVVPGVNILYFIVISVFLVRSGHDTFATLTAGLGRGRDVTQ